MSTRWVAVLAAVAVVGGVVTLVVARRPGRAGRAVRAVAADLRTGVLGRHTWPGIVAASVLVVAGHVATFVVAAHAAGVTASPPSLLPLALLVLVAMGVPLNFAGWGPREGAAAWLFGASGLGSAAGMGTAVVYGVLVLVASLPGAALLFVSRRTRASDGDPGRGAAPAEPVEPVVVSGPDVVEGGARG